ncbi:uncharacterized protein LOC106354226 [Brassica napus]|uniref:uncharacterized protein LOC106354226 n=1 Tax=Brassica napus TaxID=3708 RepID=UPI0006AB070D|nr:uncharacterized protein LOC106354226 [Brassica napus]XP_013649564.1 uncharacterized protein LOC106354226 [Brassica napus]XP_048636984.1 uncharacterized protein LOC106354226 [Brassica napus]
MILPSAKFHIIEFLCMTKVTGIQPEKGMAKLTNIQAAEILVEGVYAKVDAELLRFVAEIFGKTYTFQLKIGEFNFPSKPQTFTISCIFAERHQSPLPGFVIDRFLMLIFLE